MESKVAFQRRLSYFTRVTETSEPRLPWPLKGKSGDSGAGELALAETPSVKDLGFGQPFWPLGPERAHPFPLLF